MKELRWPNAWKRRVQLRERAASRFIGQRAHRDSRKPCVYVSEPIVGACNSGSTDDGRWDARSGRVRVARILVHSKWKVQPRAVR